MKTTRDRAAVPPKPEPKTAPRVHSANDEYDPYRIGSRPQEPTKCPECRASFTAGRWSWNAAPKDSYLQLCPACRRTQDRFPAGYVTIRGKFLKEHRDEIVQFVTAHGEREKELRPLHRIMAIEDVHAGLQVTTTDPNLARGIAEALHEEFKGEMKLRHSRDENLLRALWQR